MKIIGGLIPWLGFRVIEISCEEAASFGIHHTKMGSDMNHVLVNALEVEWFGAGITLCAKGIQ